MQGWILEQKRDIHGKTSEMQAVSSLVNNNISVLVSLFWHMYNLT